MIQNNMKKYGIRGIHPPKFVPIEKSNPGCIHCDTQIDKVFDNQRNKYIWICSECSWSFNAPTVYKASKKNVNHGNILDSIPDFLKGV